MSIQAMSYGLTHVDPAHYNGWDGRDGCWGCVKDVERFTAVVLEAVQCGHHIRLLEEQATKRAYKDSLFALAARATDPTARLTILYGSGHGSNTPDLNGDERDGFDETKCLFDGEIIDDAIWSILATFPPDHDIIMVSDTCASGTPFRAGPPRPNNTLNQAEDMKANIIHMGGCHDAGSSEGERDGGVFTKALCGIFANTSHLSNVELFAATYRTVRAAGYTQRPSFSGAGPNPWKLWMKGAFKDE